MLRSRDSVVDLFETIAGVIQARSGGRGGCVLGVRWRTDSGLEGQGAVQRVGVSGVIWGRRRGWKWTGMTGSVTERDMSEAGGGGLMVQRLGGNVWAAGGVKED